jgi:hypothetical protein
VSGAEPARSEMTKELELRLATVTNVAADLPHRIRTGQTGSLLRLASTLDGRIASFAIG